MRDWLNKEKLSMELLSSDENLGCISRDSGRAPFDGAARPGNILLLALSPVKKSAVLAQGQRRRHDEDGLFEVVQRPPCFRIHNDISRKMLSWMFYL